MTFPFTLLLDSFYFYSALSLVGSQINRYGEGETADELLKGKARDELKCLTKQNLGCEFAKLGQRLISIAVTKKFIREIYNPRKAIISEEVIIDGVVA